MLIESSQTRGGAATNLTSLLFFIIIINKLFLRRIIGIITRKPFLGQYLIHDPMFETNVKIELLCCFECFTAKLAGLVTLIVLQSFTIEHSKHSN